MNADTMNAIARGTSHVNDQIATITVYEGACKCRATRWFQCQCRRQGWVYEMPHHSIRPSQKMIDHVRNLHPHDDLIYLDR